MPKPHTTTTTTATTSRNHKKKKPSTSAAAAVVATTPALEGGGKEKEKDAEEAELERLVFGDPSGFYEGLLDGVSMLRGEGGGLKREEKTGSEEDEKEEEEEEGGELEALRDDQLFFIDSNPTPTALHPATATTTTNGDDNNSELALVPAAAAWEDSDDDQISISLKSQTRLRKLRDTELEDRVSGKEYTRRLRRQFERIYPIPDWALPPSAEEGHRRRSGSRGSDMSLDGDDDDDGDESVPIPASLSELLQSNQEWYHPHQGTRGARILRPETLNIARLPDANQHSRSVASISSLSFHPTHPLLLSAGLDSTLRLYHIDGKYNLPATSLHIRHTPIYSADFHCASSFPGDGGGTKIFAGGRRRYFHIWDLTTGAVEKVSQIYGHSETQKSMENFKLSPDGTHLALVGSKGCVNILSATSGQWIAAATVDDQVSCISWWFDSAGLTISGKHGEVWEYSLFEREFVGRWMDEGGMETCMVCNGGERWVVVGQASGVVNIYDRRLSFGVGVGAAGSKERPKPVKVLESLVTPVTVVGFSPDLQVVAVGSSRKKNALRLVHLPSCTVYKTWPTANTPLGRVTAVAFAGGKETGMMAVGNDVGMIRLFEIR